MKIKYKMTIYDLEMNLTEIESVEIEVDSNTLFCDLINLIKEKHILDNEFHQIYVEDLSEKTWGKIFNQDIIDSMEIDSFHYGWLNYKIIDIQKMFNLFDEAINIVVDGPGIGKICGKKEGIKFIIHSDEKDKHAQYPHVHCEYSGESIFVYLNPIKLLNDKGFKNRKKTKVALKWIEENQAELLNYWNKLVKSDANIDFNLAI